MIQMNNMKQRAMRRWLTEIAQIVQNPSIDVYTAHSQIKQKFDAISVPKSAVVAAKVKAVNLSEIDEMIRNDKNTTKIPAIRKYREMTGLGLLEAKRFIENRVKVLSSQPRRRSCRAKFRSP